MGGSIVHILSSYPQARTWPRGVEGLVLVAQQVGAKWDWHPGRAAQGLNLALVTRNNNLFKISLSLLAQEKCGRTGCWEHLYSSYTAEANPF